MFILIGCFTVLLIFFLSPSSHLPCPEENNRMHDSSENMTLSQLKFKNFKAHINLFSF